jgi:serine/threonine protein kinase
MAEVFKAKSFGVAGFERIVAVKRILPTLAEDDEFITMFIDEARIAAHLTHQNIVQIYELGSNDGTFFISMEYVAGRDLRQILDHQKKLKKPLEAPKAAFIVSQVCEALEYAHRKKDPAGKDLKIIHRDVTPQNVIISYEGEVKLCDFGIAKAASRASRTQVGVLKGKFAYMSPEQVRGQPTDRRSDLFALGVIFYEMLTGERLFLGESDYSTLEAVRNARVPAPRKFNPNLTKELEEVVMKMLARDPKDRYQWASEVHEGLQDHVIDEGRAFHARHLRQWVQDVYARDIEVENAKLEEFMRLEAPPDGAESPEAVEESRSTHAPDPADGRTYAPLESAQADDTDNYPIPPPRASSRDSVPTRPIDEEPRGRRRTESGTVPHEPTPKKRLGEAPVPNLEAPSPVSSLFGAPELGADVREVEKDAVVVAADGSGPKHDSIEGEVERTLFDMKPMPELGDNDTLFEDDGETDGGAGDEEIDGAQEALLERLESAGALEDNDTVDASAHSEEVVAPDVSDPSEVADRRSSAATQAGEIFGGDAMDDETAVSPRALAGAEEDAFAPTMIRPSSNEDMTDDTNEEFQSLATEGTIEESPSGMVAGRARSFEATDEEGEPTRAEGSERKLAPRRRIREKVSEDSAGKAIPPRPDKEDSKRTRAPAPPPVEQVAPRPFAPVAESTGISRPIRDPVVLMLIAAAVGLLSVSVLVVSLLQSGDDDEAASLQILTEPVLTVDVRVDGELMSSGTPVTVPGLAIGSHTVELSAPGYKTYTQRIQIAQAKPHTMVVPLEALPKPSVEVEPVVEAPPPSIDPPPSAAVDPPPPPPVAPVPRPVARPKLEEGFLMVITKPSGVPVMIDGRETGLRTPIRQPYALRPGKHTVSFSLDDGRRIDFPVRIEPGATVRMDKTLR